MPIMAGVTRRVASGVEFATIHVEHTFDLDATVAALLVTKCTVRVDRRPRPLQMGDVREALHYLARRGDGFSHPVWQQYADEPPDGPLHRLAQWLREELYRLKVFTPSGAHATGHGT